jgi:hypothetical protein
MAKTSQVDGYFTEITHVQVLLIRMVYTEYDLSLSLSVISLVADRA